MHSQDTLLLISGLPPNPASASVDFANALFRAGLGLISSVHGAHKLKVALAFLRYSLDALLWLRAGGLHS